MGAFESGVSAGKAKAGERAFIDQFEDTKNDSGDLSLSLESPADERKRIQDARLRTEGTLQDLKINQTELARTTGKGVKSDAELNQLGRDHTSAQEHFGLPASERDPLIESDQMTAERIAAKKVEAEKQLASLEANYTQRQLDIISLEGQISNQKDDTLRAAQSKVLAQFKREQQTVVKEIEELRQIL